MTPRGGRSQPTVNPPPPSFSPWMRQPLNLSAFLLWQAGGYLESTDIGPPAGGQISVFSDNRPAKIRPGVRL